jgi:ATP synthase protein I
MDKQSRSPRERRRAAAEEFTRRIGREERRKQRGRREGDNSLWFGLGVVGVVGWSVAIPTLLGVALGIWIDTTWPSRFSWSLMLLIAGVALGSLNAWYWVKKAGISKASGEEEP